MQTEREEFLAEVRDELLADAWALIAYAMNHMGSEWQPAAYRWRDHYHSLLHAENPELDDTADEPPNQCDGCRRGLPRSFNWNHVSWGESFPCTANRSEEQGE